MAQTKRRSEPTHPTVWIGLGLALAGLVVAMYAYTGPRVYDITFFFVAILGGLLALGGILASAWGRAVGQARRQRARRLSVSGGKPGEVPVRKTKDAEPPTVAAPRNKRSLLARFKIQKSEPAPKPVFAFKRKTAPDAAAASDATPEPAEAPTPDAPRKERVTVQCPDCSTTFSQDGVRPFRVACPNCAFSSEV